MKMDYIKLAVSIVFCQAVGFIGSVFTAPNIPLWYSALKKPFFNPPDWVFGIVWTVLFLLMGVSLYIVWNRGLAGRGVKAAMGIFGVQLFLNILWSALFFGMRSPLYAFIEIFFLWSAILLTIMRFYRISGAAAYLLVPYLIWVGFAIFLNYSIWVLNA